MLCNIYGGRLIIDAIMQMCGDVIESIHPTVHPIVLSSRIESLPTCTNQLSCNDQKKISSSKRHKQLVVELDESEETESRAEDEESATGSGSSNEDSDTSRASS